MSDASSRVIYSHVPRHKITEVPLDEFISVFTSAQEASPRSKLKLLVISAYQEPGPMSRCTHDGAHCANRMLPGHTREVHLSHHDPELPAEPSYKLGHVWADETLCGVGRWLIVARSHHSRGLQQRDMSRPGSTGFYLFPTIILTSELFNVSITTVHHAQQRPQSRDMTATRPPD